ncbi:hypothetical protein N7490_011592 [Penicillium lividum]|nr:hypothetical protein N7490_011592 [Penicillium lividum]
MSSLDSQLSRAWQAVSGEHDWDGQVSKIKDLSTQCTSLISPLEAEKMQKDRDHEIQTIQESRDKLKEIQVLLEAEKTQNQEFYKDQKKRELLQALSFSQYEDDKILIPPKVKGTCRWLPEDDRFRTWRDSDTCNLLWVTAGPGCGKSVLTRDLIDGQQLSTRFTTSTVCYLHYEYEIIDETN